MGQDPMIAAGNAARKANDKLFIPVFAAFLVAVDTLKDTIRIIRATSFAAVKFGVDPVVAARQAAELLAQPPNVISLMVQEAKSIYFGSK